MRFKNKDIKNDKLVFNKVNSKLEINIDGDIGEDVFDIKDGYTFNQFKDEVEAVIDDVTELVINISSYGGDVYEAYAIYDYIKSLDIKVITNVVKSSASAATIIALAGDERLITPNSKYLIHKPMTGQFGNSDDFEKTLAELIELDDQIVDLYVNKSKLSSKEVISLMKEEKFINAELALEYGFVDRIVNTNKDNNKDNNVMDKEIMKMVGATNLEQFKNKIKMFSNSIEEKEKLEKENEEMKAKIKSMEEQDKDEDNSDEEMDEIKAENASLKETLAELEAKMAEIEETEKKKKEEEVTNFVDSYVESGFINEDAKDKWVGITNQVGIDSAKGLLNSIKTPKAKLSKEIDQEEAPKSKSEVINLWKQGKISTSDYLNRLK